MISAQASSHFIAFVMVDDGEALASLLAQGLDANTEVDSDSRRTPLMLAARVGGPNTVRVLVQAGADVTAPRPKGRGFPMREHQE